MEDNKQMIQLGRLYVNLEKKHSKLHAKQEKLESKLEHFKEIEKHFLFSGSNNADKNDKQQKMVLSFRRIKHGSGPQQGIIYLNSERIRKDHCDVCGKRRKTTAHHLLPQRVPSINKELAQLRIRVCSECDEGIHPENPYPESMILRKQQRRIVQLETKLKKSANDIIEPFWDIIDLRRNQVLKDIRTSKKNIPVKQLHTFHKYCEGKMLELDYFRKKIKFIVNRALGTNVKGPVK